MLSVPPLPELCSPLFSTLSELPWLPVLPVHPNKAAQRLPWEQDTFLGQTPLHFPILYHISFPLHPHHHWPHHKLSTKWMCHHVLTSFIVPWGSCFHLVLLKTQRASEAKELIQKQRQKRSVMQGHGRTKCFCICCHCIGLRAAFHLGNIQGPHRISSQAEVHRNDNIGKPKKDHWIAATLQCQVLLTQEFRRNRSTEQTYNYLLCTISHFHRNARWKGLYTSSGRQYKCPQIRISDMNNHSAAR